MKCASEVGMWDMPSGSLVTVLDEWVQCEYDKHVGFVKAKNLPGARGAKAGDMLDVKDSYHANTETCMRRHPQQDSTKGNVACYVPNGAAKVRFGEYWVECKWKGCAGFVKARHVKEATADDAAAAKKDEKAAPALRGAPTAVAAEEPPAKKARLEEPAVEASAMVVEAAADPDPVAAAPAAPVAPAEVPAVPAVVAAVPAVAPAAEAAPPAPAAAAATRTCDCCFDDKVEGVCCSTKAHFFCAECASNLLSAFCTADYADQKKGKGRALCPMKDTETPFGDGVLAGLVPQEVFDTYLQVRIKVAEQSIQEEVEKEMAGKLEALKEKLAKAKGDEEGLEVDKHRLEIIDNVLTLKCPRCRLAFLDFSGCSAVTCAGCACGFCSFCLEDCGKDAHQHFYKNKSLCPKEGGKIFSTPKEWTKFQSQRKSRQLHAYLLKLPEAMRKKVADLVAPDCKDIGVTLPKELGGPVMLSPPVRMGISVPRKLRAALAAKSKELGDAVTLKVPDAKAPVALASSAGAKSIPALKAPTGDLSKKSLVKSLPEGQFVTVDDEWVEYQGKGKGITKDLTRGWVKAKHLVGRPEMGQKVVLKDAGGSESTMVRKEAVQAEGKNCLGFLDDGVSVQVLGHWFEVCWDGGRGFVRGADVPEDDVVLHGPEEDCRKAADKAGEILGVLVPARTLGPEGGEGGKGRGRGRGRGRG